MRRSPATARILSMARLAGERIPLFGGYLPLKNKGLSLFFTRFDRANRPFLDSRFAIPSRRGYLGDFLTLEVAKEYRHCGDT